VAAYLCAVFQGALVSASSSLIYRRFAHFVGEVIPVTTLKLFSRLFVVLSPAVNKKIHQRVVGLAREWRVSQGRKQAPNRQIHAIVLRSGGGRTVQEDSPVTEPPVPLQIEGGAFLRLRRVRS